MGFQFENPEWIEIKPEGQAFVLQVILVRIRTRIQEELGIIESGFKPVGKPVRQLRIKRPMGVIFAWESPQICNRRVIISNCPSGFNRKNQKT